jgi:hypothetical protein
MKPGEHWRTKMRQAIEAEAVNIEAVVGIICAIYAWREWLLIMALARQELRHHRAVVLAVDADGRYIGEIETIPGVVAHGATEDEARANAKALGLRVLIGRVRP